MPGSRLPWRLPSILRGRQLYRPLNVAKRFVRQNFTPRLPWLNHAGNVKQRAMKLLLKLTAFIEVATGLGSIAVPAFVVQLLLGSELLGAGIPRGRLAGVALLALGIACW